MRQGIGEEPTSGCQRQWMTASPMTSEWFIPGHASVYQSIGGHYHQRMQCVGKRRAPQLICHYLKDDRLDAERSHVTSPLVLQNAHISHQSTLSKFLFFYTFKKCCMKLNQVLFGLPWPQYHAAWGAVVDLKQHRHLLWLPAVFDIHRIFCAAALNCLLQQELNPRKDRQRELTKSSDVL